MKNADLFHCLSKQSLDALEVETSSIKAGVGHAFNCVFEWLYFQYKIICEIGRLTSGRYALEAGCGAGKTIIAAKVAKKHARKGKKTIFVCPSRAAMCAGIRRTFLKADFKEEELGEVNNPGPEAMVYFLTPRKLVNLIDSNNGTFSRGVGLLVIDESHHFPRGREDLALNGRVGDYAHEFGKRRVALSMTATYGRSDGDFPMGIKKVNARVTTKYLVDKGHCPKICGCTTYMDPGDAEIDRGAGTYSVKYEGPAGKKYWNAVVDIMVQIYNEYKYPTCAFVHRVAEAELIKRKFNKKSGLGKRGLAVLTGNTPQKERDRIDAAIRSGELLGYVTCGVGAESIDIPELTVCHLICRTKSIIRLVQAIGRVLRWTPSKKFALVIDYHIKKPDVIRACLGLADYAINVGVPKGEADEFKVVDVIVGKRENEEPNITPVIKDIEDWICRNVNLDIKKKKLLAMPKGAEKPHYTTKLGMALVRHTNPNGIGYDPVFDAKIRKKQPQWFVKSADKNKKILLTMKKGAEKPHIKTKLGLALHHYTNPNNISYDLVFDAKIRKKQPQWFLDMMAENKRILLAMPKGAEKPQRDTKFGPALSRYTNPNSESYDLVFDAKIRKKQPQWFLDTMAENKRILLAMPKGAEKPHYKKTKLGNALFRYTNRKSSAYDPVFDAKIRKRQPQWFMKTSDKNKKTFLAMKKGAKKPHLKTKPGFALYRYTSPNSTIYDPVFDAAIRKRQPQWFK